MMGLYFVYFGFLSFKLMILNWEWKDDDEHDDFQFIFLGFFCVYFDEYDKDEEGEKGRR